MARAFVPKVVTANDLLEGDVIYLTASGDWTRLHEEAELYEDEVSAIGKDITFHDISLTYTQCKAH